MRWVLADTNLLVAALGWPHGLSGYESHAPTARLGWNAAPGRLRRRTVLRRAGAIDAEGLLRTLVA